MLFFNLYTTNNKYSYMCKPTLFRYFLNLYTYMFTLYNVMVTNLRAPYGIYQKIVSIVRRPADSSNNRTITNLRHRTVTGGV